MTIVVPPKTLHVVFAGDDPQDVEAAFCLLADTPPSPSATLPHVLESHHYSKNVHAYCIPLRADHDASSSLEAVRVEEAARQCSLLLLCLRCQGLVWVARGSSWVVRLLSTLRVLQGAKLALAPSLPELVPGATRPALLVLLQQQGAAARDTRRAAPSDAHSSALGSALRVCGTLRCAEAARSLLRLGSCTPAGARAPGAAPALVLTVPALHVPALERAAMSLDRKDREEDPRALAEDVLRHVVAACAEGLGSDSQEPGPATHDGLSALLEALLDAQPPEGRGPKPVVQAAQWLAACHYPAAQFSAAHCGRAARRARELFLREMGEGLVDEAAFSAASMAGLRAYDAAARGPCRPRLRAELAAEFEATWNRDRRRCGAVSLTGARCQLPMQPEGHGHAALQLKLSTLDGMRQLALPAPFSGREVEEVARRLRRECTLQPVWSRGLRLEESPDQGGSAAWQAGSGVPAPAPASAPQALEVHLFALTQDDGAASGLPHCKLVVQSPVPAPAEEFPALGQAAVAPPPPEPEVLDWPGPSGVPPSEAGDLLRAPTPAPIPGWRFRRSEGRLTYGLIYEAPHSGDRVRLCPATLRRCLASSLDRVRPVAGPVPRPTAASPGQGPATALFCEAGEATGLGPAILLGIACPLFLLLAGEGPDAEWYQLRRLVVNSSEARLLELRARPQLLWEMEGGRVRLAPSEATDVPPGLHSLALPWSYGGPGRPLPWAGQRDMGLCARLLPEPILPRTFRRAASLPDISRP
ncbi:hypothetical protein ACKKBF_B05335 [Auxenochlorella protothecoides x Auxenochlorella symbiontica]